MAISLCCFSIYGKQEGCEDENYQIYGECKSWKSCVNLQIIFANLETWQCQYFVYFASDLQK